MKLTNINYKNIKNETSIIVKLHKCMIWHMPVPYDTFENN